MGVKVDKMWVVLVVMFVMIAHTRTEIITVKPTQNFTNCTSPCLTLTECTQQGLTSLTSLTFMDGYHHLGADFFMNDLSNITLRAVPDANVSIDCGGEYSFVFINVSGLQIEDLDFKSCGYLMFDKFFPGIVLQNVTSSELTGVSLSNSASTVFYVLDSTLTITDLVVFENHLPTSSDLSDVSIVEMDNSVIYLNGTTTISRNEILDDNNFTSETQQLIAHSNNTNVILLASNCTILCDGVLIVSDNQSPSGILRLVQTILEMNGESFFTKNGVSINGALSFFNTQASLGNVTFSANTGSLSYVPGISSVAGLFLDKSTVRINGALTTVNNWADVASFELVSSSLTLFGTFLNSDNRGQGVYSDVILRAKSMFTTYGTYILRNNKAFDSTIRLENSSRLHVEGDTKIVNNTGATTLIAQSDSYYSFVGTNILENNSAIVFATDSIVAFIDNSTFRHNSATMQSAINLISSRLYVGGRFLFSQNRVGGHVDGGAIYVQNSILNFQGVGIFRENHARHGGAIYLQNRPTIRVWTGTSLTFENNQAERGAAIYASRLLEEELCVNINFYPSANPSCFFEVRSNFEFTFVNNSATQGGSILHFDTISRFSAQNKAIYQPIFEHSLIQGNRDPIVASDSYRICFCYDGVPDCDIKDVQVSARRGELFSLSIQARTPFDNAINRSVSSFIRARTLGGQRSLRMGDFQYISHVCSKLNYRVLSSGQRDEIVIAADDHCEHSLEEIHCLTFNVTYEDCPEGFLLSVDRCICDFAIQVYTNSCDVDTGAIRKHGREWIGAHRDLANNNSYLGVISCEHCPFDYCIRPPVDVFLSDPDEQCNNNRAGILCGGCEENMSLSLSDLKCVDCSNSVRATLLIPIALLGILLVSFLFVFQLTVSTGAINGLIFYANIVSANKIIFGVDQTRFFSVFIDWLNLDFGFPTCFYDGLNQLAYTSWQFAFPLYLWILVAFIIVLSHYSVRASKLFGCGNPVAVLATVILLTYNKLLRCVITIYSPASLQYPANSTDVNSLVWLYDGNVAYAQGRHAVLIVFATAAFCFIFCPYTFVLTFSQFLQRSNKISQCFGRLYLTHVISTYQAAYKPNCRFWIGLCLFVRTILLVTFANSGTSSSLLAISMTSVVLLGIVGAARGIHSNRLLDLLEISFILNLGALSVASYHVRLANIEHGRVALAYTSTVVAFVTFLVIICGLTYKRLQVRFEMNKKVDTVKKRLTKRISEIKNPEQNNTEDPISYTTQEINFWGSTRLRESLMEITSDDF